MHQYILKGMILSWLTNLFVNAPIAYASAEQVIYIGGRQEVRNQYFKNNANKLTSTLNSQTEIAVTPALQWKRGELLLPLWASLDYGLYPISDSTSSISASATVKGRYLITPLNEVKGSFIKGMSKSNILTGLSSKLDVDSGLLDNGQRYEHDFYKTYLGSVNNISEDIILFSDMFFENSKIVIGSLDAALSREEYNILGGIKYKPQARITLNTNIGLIASKKNILENKQVQGRYLLAVEEINYRVSPIADLLFHMAFIPNTNSSTNNLKTRVFGGVALNSSFTRTLDVYVALNKDIDKATQRALLGTKSTFDSAATYKLAARHSIGVTGSYTQNVSNDIRISANKEQIYFARGDYSYKANHDLFYTGALEAVKLLSNSNKQNSNAIFILKVFVNWNTKVLK